eukprot:TRINITY_DN4685_c0_g1_i2.p1 TRINITY_DN4685_c0_g1~~TRINITY_DN4685_c0_g1_i2.p1  ORF type:complete len:176 (+),score=61.46 TRINITY_DN4685_c0_g1_i2:153-680(+)
MTQEEVFEICDESNQTIGTEVRSKVHKEGILHRAVNVFVFDSKGRILIQKRSETKDVCPNLWDLSCAEHLKPGETYRVGAIRGLKEELNISMENDEKRLKKLRDFELFVHEDEKIGIKDHEFSELWSLSPQDDFKIDDDEVSEAKFVEIQQLKEEMKSNPNDFTPWFKKEFTRQF